MDFESIIVKKLDKSNLSIAESFSSRYLGRSFYTIDTLRTIMKKEHHFFHLYFYDNHCIAICYCFLTDSEELKKNYPDLNIGVYHAIGVLKSIAISEEYRHTGLSDRLTHWCEDTLNSLGSEANFCLAWKKDGRVPADRHLRAAGFECVQELEKPWYSNSECFCDICQSKPCICDGCLYRKITYRRQNS